MMHAKRNRAKVSLIFHDFLPNSCARARGAGCQSVPCRAQCEHGFVKLVESDWNKDFVDELCAFPKGAHDDQVDAASAAFRAIMRRVTWHWVAA